MVVITYQQLLAIHIHDFERRALVTSVIIPSDLKSLRKYAFSNTSVTYVVVAKHITKIGHGCFNNCLESLLLEVTYEQLLTIDLFDDQRKAITSVYIDDLVTSISYNSFCETSITSIYVPPSVREIQAGAFAYAYELSSIHLSEGLQSICSFAFGFCPISCLVIPSTVRHIGAQAVSQLKV